MHEYTVAHVLLALKILQFGQETTNLQI